MDSTSPAAPPGTSAAPSPAARWRIALLWAGAAACLFGLVQQRMWTHWHSGRFGELLVLSLLALALAWPLRRFARLRWATALACPWLLALVVYAGVLPMLGTAVLLAAAWALGGWLLARESIALQMVAGLVVIGGALAWLLPLPVHFAWSYLLLAALLVGWRRRALGAGLAALRADWREAVDASPRLAAWAVLALGLASLACWLPTLQVDDLGYHLRLPWELALQGHYSMDPETHIWALAPWLGDVLQAFPQVVTGQESRGALNAAWMALTAAGVWRLAGELDAPAKARWAAVALYASLPLTAVLGGSMQTEAPTAALLVWLLVVTVRIADADRNFARAAGVLLGGLLALKLAALAMAVLVLPWAAWRHRRQLVPARMLEGCAWLLGIGASSYVYAAVIAGNPFLPLFNATFRSPYFATANFDDMRWHAGFDAALPWNLTFNTGRYLEAFPGGGGFVLVALAGAWLCALAFARTRPLALMLLALLAVPLMATQYLRYVFPACVALCALLAVVAYRVDARRATWLLAFVCVLDFAFQANGHWMLRTGAVKEALLAGGRDEPSFRHYAPERVLLAKVRALDGSRGNVLALDPELAFSAEMGARARTTSRYDTSLALAATEAERDAGGDAWAALLRREGIGEVLLRSDTVTAAQRAGLAKAGARLQASEGQAQWWRIPETPGQETTR